MSKNRAMALGVACKVARSSRVAFGAAGLRGSLDTL